MTSDSSNFPGDVLSTERRYFYTRIRLEVMRLTAEIEGALIITLIKLQKKVYNLEKKNK